MATKAQLAAAAAEAEDVQHKDLLADDAFSADTLMPALETMLAELGITDGGQATVFISKLDANGRGGEAQVWKGDPEDFDLEQIARKFGSGEYRVKVYVKIPSGQKVLKANKVMSWLLSPEDEARRLNPTQPQQTIAQPDIARMIADAISAAIAPLAMARQPQPDPMQMMASLAGIMKDMMPSAAMQAQQAHPTNPLDMIRSVIEITQMMKGDVDPVDRGVNASTNDVLLGMVNKFAPLIMGAMAGGNAEAAPQLGGYQSTPAPVDQSSMTAPMHTLPPQQFAAPQSPQPGVEDVNLQLKMGINFLLMQCEAGGLPETYAEVVLDSVPADAVQALLSQPNPIEWLATINPRVKEPHISAWFEQLLTEVRELLAGEQDSGTAGNEGIPGGNVNVG